MNVGMPTATVRSRENPDVTSGINGDHRVVVGIIGLLIEQNCGAGDHSGFVIIVGHQEPKSAMIIFSPNYSRRDVG